LTGVYSDKLGSQDAKRIEGTRIDNGDEWSKKFFANNRELRTQLDDFGVGDNVDVQMLQDGKFWNIAAFNEIDPALVEQIAGQGNKYDNDPTTTTFQTPSEEGTKGGGKNPTAGVRRQVATAGGTSDKMSKADWAAKDQATKESIARAVAVKLAVENTKVGTKVDAIINEAIQYLPFLMGEDEALFHSPEDALNPPIE
jgi:hypothetical protein